MMRIAVIGKGNVGRALAPRFAAAGHEVVYGVRDPADPKFAGGDDLPIRSVAGAAATAEAILLAVHWGAVDAILDACGVIGGKILIDCTNALDFQRDLAWLVPADTSAAALIAAKTDARVVKAFNQVGADAMAIADRHAARPLQFAAGDDPDAKAAVLALIDDAGFDARDAGGLANARDLESLARLWIAQAFGQGMRPDTAWALVPAT